MLQFDWSEFFNTVIIVSQCSGLSWNFWKFCGVAEDHRKEDSERWPSQVGGRRTEDWTQAPQGECPCLSWKRKERKGASEWGRREGKNNLEIKAFLKKTHQRKWALNKSCKLDCFVGGGGRHWGTWCHVRGHVCQVQGSDWQRSAGHGGTPGKTRQCPTEVECCSGMYYSIIALCLLYGYCILVHHKRNKESLEL